MMSAMWEKQKYSAKRTQRGDISFPGSTMFELEVGELSNQ